MVDVTLVDLNRKQKDEVENSGNIHFDTYREFPFMWDPRKKKKMLSRVPFAMARKLNRSPYECNKILIEQVNRCNLDCWFCFVDDKDKDGSHGITKNIEQIMDEVIPILDKREDINVFEICGGEPGLFKQHVYEVIERFQEYPQYGVSIDNNLATGKYKNIDLINQKNVLFKLCLKGVNHHNYMQNVTTPGRGNIPHMLGEKSIEHLKYMEEVLDDYVIYMIDCITDKKDLDGIDKLFDIIQHPERVEILKVIPYEPTQERMKGKPFPDYVEGTLFNAWIAKLEEHCGKKIDSAISPWYEKGNRGKGMGTLEYEFLHNNDKKTQVQMQRYLDCMIHNI
ncbi:MAG: radical SAM protein [Candidatus Nanoarchaeia archaeon]|nr:radical SAM protein [Candidatus Nanoarchaeia archaeon]